MRIATPAKFALLFVLGLLLTLAAPQDTLAASPAEIDAEVDAALVRFYAEVPAAKDLAKKAKGILIFPSVVKAGFGVGGEYGEGALRIGGKSVGYYNNAAASIGFQIGVQSRAEILIFVTGCSGTAAERAAQARRTPGLPGGCCDRVCEIYA